MQTNATCQRLVNLLVTEHKSVGTLRPAFNTVRVFVDNDLHYGYFVEEQKLFEMLGSAQKEQYLGGRVASLNVPASVAQAVIDIGTTPYAKQTLFAPEALRSKEDMAARKAQPPAARPVQEVQSAQALQDFGLPVAASVYFAALKAPRKGTHAFCDGACTGNGQPGATPGGWGVVIINAEGKTSIGCGGLADTTNNQMELTAAIEALKALPQGAEVVLHTDSQYVTKGCTEWRKGWEKKGMRNSRNEPVANADLWKQLWQQADARKVQFQWVKGHNGDPGNEIADSLAVLGASAAV